MKLSSVKIFLFILLKLFGTVSISFSFSSRDVVFGKKGRYCRYDIQSNISYKLPLFHQNQQYDESERDVLEDDFQTSRQHRLELVQKFVDSVEDSIRNNTFASLTLRGMKQMKKSPKSNNKQKDIESLRGSIRQVQGRLISLSNRKDKKDDIQLQLTIKYHQATDICKNVGLNESSRYLLDLILNPKVISEWGIEALQSQPIRGGQLICNNGDTLELMLDPKNIELRKYKIDTNTQHHKFDTSSLTHDRKKQVPLSNHADFLQKLGLTNHEGKPRPGMKSKLKQCQKFVEIVGALVEKAKNIRASDTTERHKISVLDMGCGRGYLTFALHSYLQEKYSDSFIATLGIDVRPKLVAEISAIAKSLGDPFQTLEFKEGNIDEIVKQACSSQNLNGDERLSQSALDILVALHACDTATDDALYSGIVRGADVIVTAPCCHKEIRPQIDANFSTKDPILRHGIYRERIAETVTDSLRALLLESAGYKVQVFEFIGGEHTSKNVMITAVKVFEPLDRTNNIQEQITSTANIYGIQRQKLAQWMNIDLEMNGMIGKEPIASDTITIEKKFTGHRMPPR